MNKNPDSKYIQTMFDNLSPRYDFFCFLTSLGQDSRWRRIALEPLQPNMRVLDLGCGTGDLSLLAAGRFPEGRVQVVGMDFSEKMLEPKALDLLEVLLDAIQLYLNVKQYLSRLNFVLYFQ